MPVKVQPLAGGESLQVLAHDAEKAATAHCGDGSKLPSGVKVAWAQQRGIEAGQSEAVVQESAALEEHVEAQAFVRVERSAQQIWLAVQRLVVPRGPQVGPGAGPASGAASWVIASGGDDASTRTSDGYDASGTPLSTGGAASEGTGGSSSMGAASSATGEPASTGTST
jgi:hypothetical protein